MSDGELCPECDGTFFRPVVVDGVQKVERCRCWAGQRETSVMGKAGVPERYLECALDPRSDGRPFEALRESLERAHRIAERWAESFPDVDAGLLFMGPPGVGKTHLAVAILRRILVERKVSAPALFRDYRTLLREIRGSYHPDNPASEMDVLRPVLDAEPLVLDDLGGESPTLWVLDTFFYILNHRYNSGKLTIITTNYSDRPAAASRPGSGRSSRLSRPGSGDDTLSDRVTARLRSRLYEMCRDVRMEGEDFRHNAAQANFLS